ncbi:hypothetical protein KIN20_018925 [Parelaphostrongylus tenuis]|uniref:K Homology domain-containing protein n=1 Tax=Parelaphostrongylus tenuis TaxID=148309 RepID=A0AAD5MK50_PARTN|nr:hypothetical protein KIN20_018925 [Parelaphostrongylus tenuis]
MIPEDNINVIDAVEHIVTIPPDLNGAIIGRAGDRINKVRKESGAQIQLVQSTGQEERVSLSADPRMRFIRHSFSFSSVASIGCRPKVHRAATGWSSRTPPLLIVFRSENEVGSIVGLNELSSTPKFSLDSKTKKRSED